MKWSNAFVWVAGFGFVAICVIIYILYPRPDQAVVLCSQLIPRDLAAQFHLKGSEKDGSFDVGLAAGQVTKLGDTENTAKIIAAITACGVQLGRRVIVTLEKDEVDDPEEPLGQVADRWKSGQGLHIDLPDSPSAEAIMLNNVRMAPASGTRAQVMQTWCQKNERCVVCDPADPSDATSHVVVSIRDASRLKKIPLMSQPWPIPDPAVGPAKPWQLVEAAVPTKGVAPTTGIRYVYKCVP